MRATFYHRSVAHCKLKKPLFLPVKGLSLAGILIIDHLAYTSDGTTLFIVCANVCVKPGKQGRELITFDAGAYLADDAPAVQPGLDDIVLFYLPGGCYCFAAFTQGYRIAALQGL